MDWNVKDKGKNCETFVSVTGEGERVSYVVIETVFLIVSCNQIGLKKNVPMYR